MAIRRISIDYTVYTPSYAPGEGECWDLRTLEKAKAKARGFGPGARVHRNFNQKNKAGKPLGGWWQEGFYWRWDGSCFSRAFDSSGSSSWEVVFPIPGYKETKLGRRKR